MGTRPVLLLQISSACSFSGGAGSRHSPSSRRGSPTRDETLGGQVDYDPAPHNRQPSTPVDGRSLSGFVFERDTDFGPILLDLAIFQLHVEFRDLSNT